MNGEHVVDGEMVMDGPTQLVRQPTVSDVGPDLLAMLEKRNNLLERVLEYAIKATHSEQWNDLGGKPWPTGPACEAMARRCGVSITNMRRHRRESSDDRGEFYIWVVDATASLPSGFDSIEAFGTCSSRDTFLGTETTKGRKVSEIDEGNIMKAAYTNMLVNAITRLLGVRNLSWARLQSAGLAREKMGKVDYEKGAQGGGGNKAAGLEEVMKFGPAKDSSFAQMSDEHLVHYRTSFEKELPDPEKAKFKKKNEERIALITGELARRANTKAGTAAKAPSADSSFWERLKDYAKAQNVPLERLQTLTKGVLKTDKVDPSTLVQEDFTAIANAVAAEAKAEQAKKETF